MEQKRTKWLDYFELLDALKPPGCPLCNRVEDLSWKFLGNLYYERLSYGGTRVALVKAKGVCNWHAWMSTEIRDSDSGIAIIYKQLLGFEIERLSNWIKARGSSSKQGNLRSLKKVHNSTLSLWTQKAPCPICEAVREYERMEEGVLLDFIDEDQFSKQFEKSSGICIRHLICIIQAFGVHPNLSLLVGKQLEKYKSLSQELGEYDRKRAYQFSNEPKGSEADPWKRVFEQFAGHREVFGNEMDHRNEWGIM